MAVLPGLVEVRCRICTHLLFRAREHHPVLVEIRCACKRLLWVRTPQRIDVLPELQEARRA